MNIMYANPKKADKKQSEIYLLLVPTQVSLKAMNEFFYNLSNAIGVWVIGTDRIFMRPTSTAFLGTTVAYFQSLE